MSIKTNLRGRLKNTSLPYKSGLLPLFEAIVNSIHGIEEAGIEPNDGKIEVYIQRKQKQETFEKSKDFQRGPGRTPNEDIIAFKITDNGIGFDDPNMESFKTLDSEHKIDKGCRGVGRLLWLKAFENVSITSVYHAPDGKSRKRTFNFGSDNGVLNEEDCPVLDASQRETTVTLDGFKKKFRDSSFKSGESIAESIFEHCLWYYIRSGGCPPITVWDSGEGIELDSICAKHIKNDVVTDTIEVKGQSFEVNHVKIRSSAHLGHKISFCAGNRLVVEEKIEGKIPGLFGDLNDSEGTFYYVCYVTSEFLDNKVRSERTGFDIEEEYEELLKHIEISMADIREKVLEKSKAWLESYLQTNRELSKERLNNFVSTRAPRYRPILSRIPESKLLIDPSISDKELDVHLFKQLSEVESDLLKQGHGIMHPKLGELIEDYQARIQEYLEKAEDLKASDLANYVSHRRVILDLFEMAIKRNSDGHYVREDLIHNLIMPMRKDSNEVFPDSCNLWLFDESLAFHEYLASDKTLKAIPITSSDSTKEPDLLAFNLNGNPFLASESDKPPFPSITVIEIKRPMRNDATQGEEKDPIEQCLGYLERIRNGKVTTKDGRPIPNANKIPGFCYVLCDLTTTVRNRCKMHSMTQRHDDEGYFHYNPNFNAYIEVVSFDRLV